MTFQEYCKSKKIDDSLFRKGDAHLYKELSNVFAEVHPDSFTSQKKFLINNLRRKYTLVELEESSTETISVNVKPKPVISKPRSGKVAVNPKIVIPKPKSKPVIPKPKTSAPKPVIPGVKKKEEKNSGPDSLKPKIPTASQKKALALKPKIQPKNKD